MKHALWRKLGVVGFWLLWPPIVVYARITGPRTRVLITNGQSVLVIKNWLSPGGWSLAGGGIHKGEAPIDAAIREVHEELGLVLEKQALVDLGSHVSVEAIGLVSKYYLYQVEFAEQPALTLQPSEIMEATWMSAEDLLQHEKHVSATIKNSLQTWQNNGPSS